MEPEVAIRLAATAEGMDSVTVEHAKIIVRTLMRELSRCPVCGDSGTVTLHSEIVLTGLVDARNHKLGDAHLPTDKPVECVVCGGRDNGAPRGDPEHVVWVCRHGDRAVDCRHKHDLGTPPDMEDHKPCGYRLVLPLDLFTGTDGR